MSRRVQITLAETAGRGCRIVDLDSGEEITKVRKVTIVCEVGKPTVATVEVLAASVDAVATAAIVAPPIEPPPSPSTFSARTEG